jgi:hypothetical protein
VPGLQRDWITAGSTANATYPENPSCAMLAMSWQGIDIRRRQVTRPYSSSWPNIFPVGMPKITTGPVH